MGKAMYLGVSSKARKGKKAYIGVDGKARKIKKMYIGDANGKARLFWSGGNTKFVSSIAVGNMGSSGDYSYNFLIMDDFKNTSDVRMTTRESSNFYTKEGYNFWEKNFFLCNDGIRYFQSDSDTYSTTTNKYDGDPMNSFSKSFLSTLSNNDNCLYSIGLRENTLGGGPTGAGGFTSIHMLTVRENMSTSVTQLTASYANSTDTRPATLSWSYSSDSSGATSTYYYASRGAVYNDKLYFLVVNKYYISSSGMQYPTNKYGAALRVVDLSTNTLSSTSACSLGAVAYSQDNNNGMSNDYMCFFDVLGFSDGVLMFFDKSIYKLGSDGNSATKLVDVFSSTYACTSGKVIKITETKFIISGHTYDGSQQSKIYEFKNGTLTLLKSLGSANYTYIINSVPIDGALVCAYSVCSSTLGVANHYVLYSLNYGETWTSNEAKISVGNQDTNRTFYHTTAQDII